MTLKREPRTIESHAFYYVGTNGRITVWRRTVTQTYRSVIIREFNRCFSQKLPDGPDSYPVEQIGVEEWRRLLNARSRAGQRGRVMPNESWIDNADLPVDLVLPLPIQHGASGSDGGYPMDGGECP